jgi:diguanylate cyclase (GGDEF)-like protein
MTSLRPLKTLLRIAFGIAVCAIAGFGIFGAFALARVPDAQWPTSGLHLVALAAAVLMFVVGFVGGILRLAQLAGSRRPRSAVAPAQVASLEQAALTDSLTGLRNHRAFHEDLKREIARRNRTGTPFSLLMIDLNRLKQLNDTLGHQAGDEAIKGVGEAIRATVRDQDGGYRVGGDEFMVVLPSERAWGALNAANRLHTELSLRGNASVTVGIAESTVTESKDTLIRRADLALYEAKRCHLGTVVYSPELEPQRDEAISEETRHMRELIAAALARAVDAKDTGTRNHCETVGALSAMIGQRLGLETERLRQLRVAGLLHDVGKIGIADSILQKPGPLSEAEWTIMRTHAGVGHSIVSATELEEEARWVLHHHERFDGSGYPNGATADEIPLESRIIFVADDFEAMTADRPYRQGRSPEEALDELARNAGTQFDPLCVAALCAVFDYVPETPLEVVLDELDEVGQRRTARAQRVEILRSIKDEEALKSRRLTADR